MYLLQKSLVYYSNLESYGSPSISIYNPSPLKISIGLGGLLGLVGI